MVLDQFGNYLLQTVMQMAAQANLQFAQDQQEWVQSTDSETRIRFIKDPLHGPKIVQKFDQARSAIYASLLPRCVDYSCHKFASNVVEKCILDSSDLQISQIVREMLGHDLTL